MKEPSQGIGQDRTGLQERDSCMIHEPHPRLPIRDGAATGLVGCISVCLIIMD